LFYITGSAADGDILRRHEGKGRSKAALQKSEITILLCAKGHSVKLSEEIYRQIESFVGYSFQALPPAPHAVESYQSLYLKKCTTLLSYGSSHQQPWRILLRTEVYVHEAKMFEQP
jgi:DNA polymerase-3 subunit alpha/error-prone DNA polymerase